jgi:hypothetical protein
MSPTSRPHFFIILFPPWENIYARHLFLLPVRGSFFVIMMSFWPNSSASQLFATFDTFKPAGCRRALVAPNHERRMRAFNLQIFFEGFSMIFPQEHLSTCLKVSEVSEGKRISAFQLFENRKICSVPGHGSFPGTRTEVSWVHICIPG